MSVTDLVRLCDEVDHARLTYSVERLPKMARLVLLSVRLRIFDGETKRITAWDLAKAASLSASTVVRRLHELHVKGLIHWDTDCSEITALPLPEMDGDTDLTTPLHWCIPHARLPRSVERLPKMARLVLISLRLRIKDHVTVRMTVKELSGYAKVSLSTVSAALHQLHAEGFIRWTSSFSEITALPLFGVDGSLGESQHAPGDHEDSPGDQVPATDMVRAVGSAMPTNAPMMVSPTTPAHTPGSLGERASLHDQKQQQRDTSFSASQEQITRSETTPDNELRFALHDALTEAFRAGQYINPGYAERCLTGRPDGTVAEFEEDLVYAEARPNIYSPLGLTLSSWADGKRVSPPQERRAHADAPHAPRQRRRTQNHTYPERPIDPEAFRAQGFVFGGDSGDALAADAPPPDAPDDTQANPLGNPDQEIAQHLDQARAIAPDADAEELLWVAGDLWCGLSAEEALDRLATERMRLYLLPPPVYVNGVQR